MPAEDARTDTVVRGNLVGWVIFAVDHQLTCLIQQLVTISAQVPQLNLLSSALILGGNRLNSLQCRLISYTTIRKIDDNALRILFRCEQLDKAVC